MWEHFLCFVIKEKDIERMPSSKEGKQERKSGASVLNHENNDKISKKKDTLSYLFLSKHWNNKDTNTYNMWIYS